MGRGVVLHMAAKIVVILSGFLLQYLLAHTLSVEDYGIMGMIVVLCNFYYMFLTDGAKQAISKNISSNIYNDDDVLKKAILVQIVLGVLIGFANFFLAPVIAHLFREPQLTMYFRSISLLVPLAALFFAYTGALNGMKYFLGETVLLMVYPVLRLSGVWIAGAMPQDKPLGVVAGFTLAAAICLAAAIILVSHKKKVPVLWNLGGKSISYRETLSGTGNYIAFFAGVIVMLNMGVFILRGVMQSNELAGYYTAVYNFALVPYYIISAFFLVLLPYVSECYGKGEVSKIRDMLSKNLRIVVLFAVPVAILLCCSAKSLMLSFYGETYLPAVLPMQIQVIGVCVFAISVIFNVVLTGIGKRKIVTLTTVIMLAADVALHVLWIHAFGMVGASMATLVVGTANMATSGILLWKQIGPFVKWRSYGKPAVVIGAMTAVCAVLFGLVTFTGLGVLILVYLGLGAAYLLVSLKCGIFRIADIKSLVKKKTPADEARCDTNEKNAPRL